AARLTADVSRTDCYSSSVLPRPPASPLFPYTTLFRSQARAQRLRQRHRTVLGVVDPHQLAEPFAVQHLRFRLGVQAMLQHQAAADRKSTRLNSSHVKISYAVFCLKKKKKIAFMQPPHH